MIPGGYGLPFLALGLTGGASDVQQGILGEMGRWGEEAMAMRGEVGMGRWLHDNGDLKLEPRSTPPANAVCCLCT